LKLPNRCPNFEDFRESDESVTALLANEAGRTAYVNKLADEVDNLIKRFRERV
jgi:hypothetical protein